jgi:hypothetical protein
MRAVASSEQFKLLETLLITFQSPVSGTHFIPESREPEASYEIVVEEI